MEENIQDIKRNIQEIGKDIDRAHDKNIRGEDNQSELFMIRERVWNISQYISDLETFI